MAEFPGEPTSPSAAPQGYSTPATIPQRNEPPLTSAEVEAIRGDFIEMLIRTIVEVVVGIFIPGDGSAIDQLAEWATEIPLIGPLIGALTGIDGGGLGDLLGNLLPGLFGPLPAGNVTNEQPNLLTAPTFPTGSIPTNVHWSVDSGTRSSDGSGSAKVIADGTAKALRSGRTPHDKIRVTAGQTFTGQVFVSHTGYTGSGVAVELQAVPYTGNSAGAPVTLIKTVTPASGGSPVEQPARYTPTQATRAWPGVELAGDYLVPAGVTGVQLRILLTENATAGTFYFDDAKAGQGGLVPQELVDGLPPAIAEGIARVQNLIDTLFNGITGLGTVDNILSDLLDALANIPSGNVTGVNGPDNIGQSLIDMVNQLVGGLVGQPGTGASNADVFNVSKLISSMASQGANSWEVLGFRNNTPVDSGLLPSSEANYNITVVNTSLACTQAASLIGIIRVQRSAPLGLVSWLGCGTSGMSAFYVNIWKINSITGVWTLAHHSANILGDIVGGSVPSWNFYSLPTPMARVMGEDYAYELVPVGGTHTVRGFSPNDNIPDHPYAQVVALAATRNNTSNPNSPPTTIAKASVVRSGNIPWIETAIDTGTTGTNQHDPVTVYLTQSTTVPIPSWASYIEVIPLGGGGGGRQGGTLGFYGDGGKAGRWNPTTWEYGVHFDDSVTNVTFECGVGGRAGGTGGSDVGGAGGTSTFSIPGHSISAEGGEGGTDLRFGTKVPGASPGTFRYNDEPYVGGGTQGTTGSEGAAPGGGGGGGNAISLQNGGRGANGAGWIRFRQGARDVEEEGDVTPPTAPTVISLVNSTPSSLTVTAIGATD